MATVNINDIIIRPVVTEKTSKRLENNVYTLEINKKATKLDVKKAVEFIFSKSNAKVEKIAIQNIDSKPKKMGKFSGYTSSSKRAIVYLKSGSIPIYGAQQESVENVEKTKKKRTLKIINTEKIMKEAEKKSSI